MRIAMRIVCLLLALLAALALLMLASRLWPASQMQKQARAALEQPLDWPGDNAWVLLETLDREGLDAAQRQALVDERAVRFAGWAEDMQAAALLHEPMPTLRQGTATLAPQPAALGAEPVKWGGSELLCSSNEAAGCLDKVRQAPEAVAAELANRQALLSRVAQLAGHGHVRTPYVANRIMPVLRALPRLFDPMAGHALAHVQGNATLAMEGLCRDMRSGRMLLTHSDNVVAAMTGQRLLQANGQLLAQVLAQLPPGQAMPAQCAVAVAPLAAGDISLCSAVRTDYVMSAELMRSGYRHEFGSTPGSSWLFNVDKTLYRSAVYMGQGCLAPLQQQLAKDLPASLDEREGSLWRMECPGNAIGCMLTAGAAPGYTGYLHDLQDVAAHQRLLGALVWLRKQPVHCSADITRHLQQLPPELVSASRPISLSADGRALQVAQRYGRRNPQGAGPISLPLPQAWWPASAAAALP